MLQKKKNVGNIGIYCIKCIYYYKATRYTCAEGKNTFCRLLLVGVFFPVYNNIMPEGVYAVFVILFLFFTLQ